MEIGQSDYQDAGTSLWKFASFLAVSFALLTCKRPLHSHRRRERKALAMADEHRMKRPVWQVGFIACGLLLWCAYLAFSWISSLSSLAQVLFGAAVGLTSIASYSNTQARRSLYRRRTGVNLAQLSLADTLALQRILPNQERALSWLPGPSDVELVRWINVGLQKAWPYFKEASSGLIMVKLEEVCNKYISGAIQEIAVGKINLGKFCPYVQGIKALPSGEGNQCCLEIKLDWRQNEDQEILMHVLTTGPEYVVQVRDFVVYCVIRLTFTPLTQELPCFAAVVFSIIEPPLIDFQTKFMEGDVRKIPGMEKAVDNLLLAALMDYFVWPSRVIVPALPGDYSDLEASCVGHLHVHLLEARNLANRDVAGRSDPYVVLFVRRRMDLMKESNQMSDTVDPIWNEQFLFNVEDSEVQKLTIKLMNADEVDFSVFVGIAELAIRQLEPDVSEDLWIDLTGDPAKLHGRSAGKIHLLVEFKPLNQTGIHENNTGSKALRGSNPSAVPLNQLGGTSSSNEQEKQSEVRNQCEIYGPTEENRVVSDGLGVILEGIDRASLNDEFRLATHYGAVAAFTGSSNVEPLSSPSVPDMKVEPGEPAETDVNSSHVEQKTLTSDCVEDGNLQSANEGEGFLESGKRTTPLHLVEEECSQEGIGADSNRISQFCEGSCSVFPREIIISSTGNSPEACNVENSTHSSSSMTKDCVNQRCLPVVGDPAWGLNDSSLQHCNTLVIPEDMLSSEIFEVD